MPSSESFRIQGALKNASVVDNFKNLVTLVGKQLEDHCHPFHILGNCFDEYVLENYSKKISADANDLLIDIKAMIKAFCFASIHFYNLPLSLCDDDADLFIKPMTDLIVRHSSQKCIASSLQAEFKKEIEHFDFQIQEFQQIHLEQLKISRFLNFSSREREGFKRVKRTNTTLVDSGYGTPDFLKKQNPKKILAESMQELLKMKTQETPNKKLSQLKKFNKKIICEIDKFWENYEVNKENLFIDPDSMLSLYIYTIIKSQYKDIIVDQKLMELFITENDNKSEKGYYLATLRIAIEWIQGQNPKSFSIVFFNLINCIREILI